MKILFRKSDGLILDKWTDDTQFNGLGDGVGVWQGEVIEGQTHLDLNVVTDLNALKLQKGQLLKKQIEDRLAAHYSPLDLLSLSNLMNEAVATGKTNRAKYLEPLNAWALGVYQLFYTAQAQLEATRTAEEVEAVTIDYTIWEGAKPDIRFSTAIGIAD